MCDYRLGFQFPQTSIISRNVYYEIILRFEEISGEKPIMSVFKYFGIVNV